MNDNVEEMRMNKTSKFLVTNVQWNSVPSNAMGAPTGAAQPSSVTIASMVGLPRPVVARVNFPK
jgi:hypothetical protein